MIAALLMLAQIAPMPPEPKPVATTIAAIRADPKRFDGRVVRLDGWVNRCAAQGCRIDERPGSDAEGPGASLTIGPDLKFDATVKPLLPTYVELDAQVDARCVAAANTCTNPASDLTVVTLRGVVSPEPPPIEN